MTRHELLVAIETLQQVSRYEQYPEDNKTQYGRGHLYSRAIGNKHEPNT